MDRNTQAVAGGTGAGWWSGCCRPDCCTSSFGIHDALNQAMDSRFRGNDGLKTTVGACGLSSLAVNLSHTLFRQENPVFCAANARMSRHFIQLTGGPLPVKSSTKRRRIVRCPAAGSLMPDSRERRVLGTACPFGTRASRPHGQSIGPSAPNLRSATSRTPVSVRTRRSQVRNRRLVPATPGWGLGGIRRSRFSRIGCTLNRPGKPGAVQCARWQASRSSRCSGVPVAFRSFIIRARKRARAWTPAPQSSGHPRVRTSPASRC